MSFQYRICKTIRWEAAHELHGLEHGHPCGYMHGHSYKAEIELVADELDVVGFVLDFSALKAVREAFDHKVLNDVIPKDFNPTAEVIAQFIFTMVTDLIRQLEASDDVKVVRVKLWETETSWAEVTLK